MCPAILGLPQKIDDFLGDRVWGNNGLGSSAWFPRAALWGVDLSIHDHVDYVYTFRVELTSQRLTKDTER